MTRPVEGGKNRVAELMADNLTLDEIAGELQCSSACVYGYVAAIKRDLGPQAKMKDLGWRGGTVWHPGRPRVYG